MSQQLKKERGLQVLTYRIECMRNSVHGRRMAGLDRDRLMQYIMGELGDVFRHGGRKHEGLALCGQVLNDSAYIGQEPPVKHGVRFVQYQDLDMGETDRFLVYVVEQATRAGHNDLDSCAELLNLRIYVHSSVDGDTFQLSLLAQQAYGYMDMFGELSCRRNDERPHGSAGPGDRRSRIGSTKAVVFPVPVWAKPMTSWPSRTCGIACFWLCVGKT